MLTGLQQRDITALVYRMRPFLLSTRPFQVVARADRVDLWAKAAPGRYGQLAAGMLALDARTAVRRLGYRAVHQPSPLPEEPRLPVTIVVGERTAMRADDRALYEQLVRRRKPVDADGPMVVCSPVWMRRWTLAQMSTAAVAEGAVLQALGSATLRRVGLSERRGWTGLVLRATGARAAGWIRIGMALERIRLVAARNRMSVELPNISVQLAVQDVASLSAPEKGRLQVVLSTGPTGVGQVPAQRGGLDGDDNDLDDRGDCDGYNGYNGWSGDRDRAGRQPVGEFDQPAS